MIIAFLDILGFSWLVENHTDLANDNLFKLRNIIRTKENDNRTNPISSYGSELREFAEVSALTSFNYLISISDSLIIASEDAKLFIRQLSNLIATVYIESTEYLQQPFNSIEDVIKKNYIDLGANAKVRGQSYFPILFRGGISDGEVEFVNENQRVNSKHSYNGLSVFGRDYVEAVKLEGIGKGPRLFCSEKFYQKVNQEDKVLFKQVIRNKEVVAYELIWTYFLFEAQYNSGQKKDNITRCLNHTILPPAINLYNLYSKNKSTQKHYLELGRIIYEGAMIYTHKNKIDLNYTKSIFIDKAPYFINPKIKH